MYKSITLETIGSAAVLTLNRPDNLNALIYPMISEFRHALAQAEADDKITGIILTGAGKGFCAGMDMNALTTLSASGEKEAGDDALQLSQNPGDTDMGEDYISGFTYMMTIRKPIIAAINGACAGLGLSIALFCDMRFAANNAKFITSFSQRGLVAEHGQSWILPRVVGPSKALDLFWSSRRVLSEEAKEIGLIDRIYAPDDLLNAALQYIEDLAKTAAPLSLMAMKNQVYRHLNMSLGEAMKETDTMMDISTAHDDFKEGVASFLEKRLPSFERIKF
ncbi:MAG: enoyl-CoA hydratase/carnithine racemase [Oceanicoccus sp.]|jgi:enoyl-CoA hydratase/carnithine racemase